jgi:chorismate-pyruvate lyase
MSQSNHHSSNEVAIESLLAIFYAEQSRLASFEKVIADRLPSAYQQLLNHSSHMTVTVESFYQDRVDVRVLRAHTSQGYYCREILLSTQGSGEVVQYGIVRLKLDLISEPARSEILGESKPLGRVLIDREILREVELFDLFSVSCGPKLAEFFGVPEGTETFGRTALIHCDHEPAIELLEIVAPVF